jgi:hypothetical protein
LKNCYYLIAKFDNFEILYDFLNSLTSSNIYSEISEKFEVYEYNNKYFFIINKNSFNLKSISLNILEFSNFISYSEILASKIREFGNNIDKIKKIKNH